MNMIVIATFFFTCVAVISYVVIFKHPPDEGVFSFKGLYYYLLPIGGILISLFMFKASRGNRTIGALIISSFAVVFLLAEGVFFFRVTYPGMWIDLLSPSHNDRRTPVEVVQDLRLAGESAYPALPPRWFEGPHKETFKKKILPLSDPTLSKIVQCNETGSWLVIDSDEYGFRNTKGQWGLDVDVVLIGDSHTFGQCLELNETVAGLLEKNFRVLNLGRPGRGPLEEFAIFTEYATKIKPPAVVWIYSERNDFDDLAQELKDSSLSAYLDTYYSQNLFDRVKEANQAIVDQTNVAMAKVNEYKPNFKGSIVKILTLNDLRTFVFDKLKPPVRPDEILTSNVKINFKEILSQAKNMTNQWGGKFILVSVPTHSQEERSHVYPSIRTFVKEVVQDLKITFLDATQYIQSIESQAFYFPQSHYTPIAHSRLASIICKEISSSPAFIDQGKKECDQD